MTDAPRVLVLDHRDSFVFNLVDELARLAADVVVLRTDLSLAALDARLSAHDPDLVVLSPGPGHPRDAGVMVPWLATRPGRPVLGVCLGMQAMALAEGGAVGRAPDVVHGRATPLTHDGHPAFADLPGRIQAARYHSLAVTRVPDALRVVARTDDEHRLPMALAHRSLPWLGVQFHPESILTPDGSALTAAILRHAVAHRTAETSRCSPP